MSYYSKVSSRFWTGETGRALRGDLEAQVVATYLVTSPHANMLGYYYLPITYVASDTGISIEGASKALQRLCDEGFCRYDRGSEVVWVIEMARIQVGESLDPKDKRVVGIRREYESIPNNLFLREFFEAYREAFHMLIARGFKAPSKPATATAAVPATATAADFDAASASRKNAPRETHESVNDPVKEEIWKTGRQLLEGEGKSRENAGSLLGKMCKDYGQKLVLDAVRDCAKVTPAKPSEWLFARCQERRSRNPADALLESNLRVAANWRPPEDRHAEN